MKKSPLILKDITNDRAVRNKSIQIPKNERNYVEEEKTLVLPRIRKYPFRKFDRKITAEKIYNPFNLQRRDKVFNYGKCSRKQLEEPFIMSNPKTICDIDRSFYKTIEGRPLRQLDDVKVYVRNIRDITLLRANKSYLDDQILQIDTIFDYEHKQLVDATRLYYKTRQNFFAFAKQNYSHAQLVKTEAKETEYLVDKVSIDLDCLSTDYIKLRNQLSVLSYSLDLSLKYRNFLTSIAPLPWRLKHNQFEIEECIDFAKLFDEADIAFSKRNSVDLYKSSMLVLRNLNKTNYFNVPEDLIKIFEDIRKQCLNYIQMNEVSSAILRPVTIYKDYLLSQDAFDIDIKTYIEFFKKHIIYMKEKEKCMKEKFMAIINREFYNLYASFDATKLFNCVQYVNNFVIEAHKDPKDNILTLMKQLESLYLSLSLSLDGLDQVVVKKAKNEVFAQDVKIMKRANLAQRTIKECDLLRKAIYVSFEQPRYKKINNKDKALK